jgi:predicted phosphodiesterase
VRIAILADIHSNLAAFEAVLEDVNTKGGFETIWCLGDVVGYGPDPRQCIELLRRYDHLCVAGNHDWAAVGKIDTLDFNPVAAAACHWTAEQLNDDDIEYLESLPIELNEEDFTLVHGSPREPIWEYLLSAEAARENFPCFATSFCLVGHSHVPLVYESLGSAVMSRQFYGEASLKLGEDRMIINPGGVGQPRDGDPRASYAVYDSTARILYHYRVEYDILATQRKMDELGLPVPLIVRLSEGR